MHELAYNFPVSLFVLYYGIETTSSNTVNNTMSTIIPFSSFSTHEISFTTPKLGITSTTSLTHTTTNNNTTIQSSTGYSHIMLLIAAVISTVLILLIVSILVIIIVSVLVYKRRKRLTLKVSSGEDVSHAYIDTSDMRKDEGMTPNPTYQAQSTYT